jgi:hypothetical protein
VSWKMIELSADDIRNGVEPQLQEAFMSRFVVAGLPPAAVMYSNANYIAEGYKVLFTPRAAEIVGSSPLGRPLVDCDEPPSDQLHVLVRNEGAPARGSRS